MADSSSNGINLWLKDAEGFWAVLPVAMEEFDLSLIPWGNTWDGGGGDGIPAKTPPEPEEVLFFQSGSGRSSGSGWVVLTKPGARVFVNGRPMLVGIHALEHKDEIRIGDLGPIYFSAERLAQVEPVADTLGEVFCPRCSLGISPGSGAVRCPACGIWHHASDEYPCWTYGPTCALCPQPSNLDVGFQWTPSGI